MYALKRILAYIIDMALVVVPIQFYTDDFSALLGKYLKLPEFFQGSLWMLQTGVPILLLGVVVGLTGKTPGKLLMFLKVVNHSMRAPGLAQGILREIIKLVCGMFFLGALYALYGIVTGGKTFYDDWLSLDVEDQKPTGLTDRQKKWREYTRNNRT